MSAKRSSSPLLPRSADRSSRDFRVSSDWLPSIRNRSDAHRAQSRDVHGIVRRGPSRLCFDAGSQGTTLWRGAISFNVPGGRCETCEGEGFLCVELLFMPSVYAPCSTCHGARYNAKTLEIEYRGRNIAQVLGMTVAEAHAFFADTPSVLHTLTLLREIGLGYLRLGSRPPSCRAERPSASSSSPSCSASKGARRST